MHPLRELAKAQRRFCFSCFESSIRAIHGIGGARESGFRSGKRLPGKGSLLSFLVLFNLFLYRPTFAAPPSGCPSETDLHLTGISFSGDSLCAARGELKVTGSEIPAGARSVFVAGRIVLGADFAVRSGGVLQSTTAQIELPVARAGGDQSAAAQATVTLDGSASEAPGGTIEHYQWQQISGTQVMLQNADQAQATFAAPSVTVNTALEFELTITDHLGFTAKDQILVTVTPGASAGDRDGDGIPDEHDAFPDDPSEAYDFDKDGIGDNADPDRDGDGVDNTADFYPDDPAQNAAPVLSIATPADGATIADETVIIEGTLDAPWNTGITINGIPAQRGGTPWGSEFILQVPLEPGANTFEVTATGKSGKQVSQTLTVTRAGSAAFHLNAAPRRAFAPAADVLFVPDIPASLSIVQADWDFDGDGTADTTLTTGFDTPITHSYITAGLYSPKLTLTDDQSQTYTQTLGIAIIDQSAQDARLKALWTGMTTALAGKNLGLSKTFLLDKAEGGYGKVFSLLLPHMPAIVSGFSALETVETGLSHAEYAVGETIDGVERVFLIQLLRDTQGVWKVDGM